jgi:hypothetical protein
MKRRIVTARVLITRTKTERVTKTRASRGKRVDPLRGCSIYGEGLERVAG